MNLFCRYIGNVIIPNWLSYFSDGLKPPSREDFKSTYRGYMKYMLTMCKNVVAQLFWLINRKSISGRWFYTWFAMITRFLSGHDHISMQINDHNDERSSMIHLKDRSCGSSDSWNNHSYVCMCTCLFIGCKPLSRRKQCIYFRMLSFPDYM